MVENQFAHGGKRFHEVGFYYQVALPDVVCPLRSGEFVGGERRLRLRWVSLAEVTTVDLRPQFLRERLAALPTTIEHLQIDELSAAVTCDRSES